jgi:hypothetical protein
MIINLYILPRVELIDSDKSLSQNRLFGVSCNSPALIFDIFLNVQNLFTRLKFGFGFSLSLLTFSVFLLGGISVDSR